MHNNMGLGVHQASQMAQLLEIEKTSTELKLEFRLKNKIPKNLQTEANENVHVIAV